MRSLPRADKTKFDKTLGMSYEVKSSNSKTSTIIVRTADRERADLKKNLEAKLFVVGCVSCGIIKYELISFP